MAERQSRDWREKYSDYQAAGVKEYRIIDLMSQTLEAYTLAGGVYQRIEEIDGRVSAGVVAEWYRRPAWLWKQPRPILLNALREAGVS